MDDKRTLHWQNGERQSFDLSSLLTHLGRRLHFLLIIDKLHLPLIRSVRKLPLARGAVVIDTVAPSDHIQGPERCEDNESGLRNPPATQSSQDLVLPVYYCLCPCVTKRAFDYLGTFLQLLERC